MPPVLTLAVIVVASRAPTTAAIALSRRCAAVSPALHRRQVQAQHRRGHCEHDDGGHRDPGKPRPRPGRPHQPPDGQPQAAGGVIASLAANDRGQLPDPGGGPQGLISELRPGRDRRRQREPGSGLAQAARILTALLAGQHVPLEAGPVTVRHGIHHVGAYQRVLPDPA